MTKSIEGNSRNVKSSVSVIKDILQKTRKRNRNGKELTAAAEIKKRWQKYTA